MNAPIGILVSGAISLSLDKPPKTGSTRIPKVKSKSAYISQIYKTTPGTVIYLTTEVNNRIENYVENGSEIFTKRFEQKSPIFDLFFDFVEGKL